MVSDLDINYYTQYALASVTKLRVNPGRIKKKRFTWNKFNKITALTHTNKDKADIAMDDAENAKNSKKLGKIWNKMEIENDGFV